MATAAQRQARDLQKRVLGLDIRTVFDVGANVGHTVQRFREAYPKAAIWAFEPVLGSYEALRSATTGLVDVQTFNIALADHNGYGRVSAVGVSDKNALVEDDHAGITETVEVIMGDSFCSRAHIDHIGYLKIDTEGSDLEVLRGFHHMLGDVAIDVLCVEAGMNSTNATHVPLGGFQGYLEPLGYHVFHLYNQSAERHGRPYLALRSFVWKVIAGVG